MLRLLILLFSVPAAVLLAGCSTPHGYATADGTMLGTTFHLAADLPPASSRELYAAAAEVDREAKASMSIFDEGSLLSRLNRNETDSVDCHIARVLRLADSIGALSGGAYDVTVKPLVEAWGFAAGAACAEPDIDSILRFVGRDKVRIEAGRLVKSDPRVQLDFNSIAKGYTVDLLARRLERLGARSYIVDIGGEVRCRGVNPAGQPWRIGVETPFDGNDAPGSHIFRRVRLSGGALATSGNYRRYYFDDEGRKVAHTIDPRTGRSVLSRLLSATVAADDCATADALCTMFMALGADEALALVRRLPGVKAYFILSGEGDSFEEYVSPAMEELMMEE